MTALTVVVTGDVEEFLATAGELLMADPVANTVVLTSLDRLRAGGRYGDDPPTFAAALDGTRAVGAASCTPPYPVVVVTDDPQAAAALADSFPRASGVLSIPDIAAAFADATGRSWSPDMREVQYRLDRLQPPRRTPGQAREHLESDLPVIGEWLRAFATETGTQQPADPRADVAARLASGGAMWLWEDDGVVVSLAGRTAPAAGVVRVGPVYTPLQRRSHGYAASLTAAVCADALDRGADGITLFTDAANSTSNSVYRRIGFVEIGHGLRIVFTDGGSAPATSGATVSAPARQPPRSRRAPPP